MEPNDPQITPKITLSHYGINGFSLETGSSLYGVD